MKKILALAGLMAGLNCPSIGNAQNATNAPVISISPTNLNFGSVAVGTISNKNFTVKNVGDGVLTGTASAENGPLSIVSGGAYSLGVQQLQAVTIRYAPVSTTGDVAVAKFTGGGGATVKVSGNLPRPSPSPPQHIRLIREQ